MPSSSSVLNSRNFHFSKPRRGSA